MAELFSSVHFKGKFRNYQARVITNAKKYLSDGKINIVAAPGSGKTVLGLELIRRLGRPCIILSPTTAIRDQWGERFCSMFLDDISLSDELYSNSLHSIKLVNSVTYQALYTAIEKVSSSDDDDENCGDVDIFAVMKEKGITTVCLDEAHHLKNEWQRALEKFIEKLGNSVRIISLTATPPYDSEGSEWERYIKVCGEIDEEIFVPELVMHRTLCPHQDYIYFNYPTANETSAISEHTRHATEALDELGGMNVFEKLAEELNDSENYEAMFASAKEYVSLLVLLKCYGYKISKKLINELTVSHGLPDFNFRHAETALDFLLGGDLIKPEDKEKIASVLKKHQVMSKGKAVLGLNEKLKRSIVSSVGKLNSIRSIVKSECESMGSKLRMLILTDYIKKENISKIATDEEMNSVNVVSIFETVRQLDTGLGVAVLSGSLVILPSSVDTGGIKHRKQPIENTDYSVFDFGSANAAAIAFVGGLLEKGEIQILIGTKSLLGEGWDSPCINTLILASFVGSFVLSNQMRGRAIRTDKNAPDKSANIWHLVTVEPEYIFKDTSIGRAAEYIKRDESTLVSCDFETLKRRFDAFMGPNYSTGMIESGIDRITNIVPPFNKQGIADINGDMLERSKQRSAVAGQWNGSFSGGKCSVNAEADIPRENRVPTFTFVNFLLCTFLFLMQAMMLGVFIRCLPKFFSAQGVLLAFLLGLMAFAEYKLMKAAFVHSDPARSLKTLGRAVYATMKEAEMLSPEARIEVQQGRNNSYVTVYLANAPVHDQNLFNTAMAEMLSPIENPRYILISKNIFGKYNYYLSFACPSVLGKKKEYADILAKHLKKATGKFEAVFVHREGGRKMILECRKRSYITANERAINRHYRVSHYE